jgi:hypothetical protein
MKTTKLRRGATVDGRLVQSSLTRRARGGPWMQALKGLPKFRWPLRGRKLARFV